MAMAIETWCAVCECAIDHDDADCTTENGDVICTSCADNISFDCCRCRTFEYTDYQDTLGCLLVITGDAIFVPCEPVSPGVYRIARHPYCQGERPGLYAFHAGAIERLGDVPDALDPDPYETGHLCRMCKAKTLTELGIQEDGDGDGEA
jgi:hypothetical protein